MKFTDIFIRRPVLVDGRQPAHPGARHARRVQLPVSQYPQTENAVVTIRTTYYGADAQTVAGFITQPLEAAIAQAQGIDYLSSSSATGVSMITATLRLNYDANRALTEISTQVNSVRNQLPPQAQQPGAHRRRRARPRTRCTWASSATCCREQQCHGLPAARRRSRSSTPYPDVQTAEILGARQFALRAWLDPDQWPRTG